MRSSTIRRAEPRAAAPIERARPLLGTLVSIRVEGLADDLANALVDAAFAEIATVHRLMSVQEPASELNRINRLAATDWVAIDRRTAACIRRGCDLASLSDGAFDPAAAGAGTLPGTARDIAIEEDRIRFGAAMRLDLSGIAKGHAVDLACAVLRDGGAPAAIVNAGGDLRVFGAIEEPVALRPFVPAAPALLAIADGALASSDPRSSRAQGGGDRHLDGRTGGAVADAFVSVAAPTCIDADALTKIVLARRRACVAMLATLGAVAYVHDQAGWSTIGEAA